MTWAINVLAAISSILGLVYGQLLPIAKNKGVWIYCFSRFSVKTDTVLASQAALPFMDS